MVTRTCKYCAESYETYPSIRLQFCSAKCANAYKKHGTYSSCPVCGNEVYSFPGKSKTYCSKSCARTAANLTTANPSYSRDISGENNPMYGKGFPGSSNPMYGRRREMSPRWKGGRKIRKDGYIFVVAPDDHPRPSYITKANVKYILEHRYVMEQHLGRYLDPVEVVHHIDNNPSNNDLANLRLYANHSEHIKDAHGA